MQPTIGQIVQYRITEDDTNTLNRRRVLLSHMGNHAYPGDTYPALVVRVEGEAPDQTCNLRVLMDGTDTHWVTSRPQGTEPGTWSWLPST
ncbi:hypothetical protein ACFVFS_17370 [Kitasatospora sp. NPDC057692]|uniref:hypothetical protein n=1 Tax=Kitasatospora sp. NPDC057692 TaxID=3346215 RepID=UPI003690CAB3